MHKIRLNVDELTVESFDTANGRGKKDGTVHGHDFSLQVQCGSVNSDCATCQPGGCPRDTQTCFASCGRTNGFQVCIEPNC